MQKLRTILEQIKGGILVSCQALKDEPLFSSSIMVKMANAARLGGAVGIRANSIEDVKAIRNTIDLPVIGIDKQVYENSECYITPTMKEVQDLIEHAGPHIIAVDGTKRTHPDGLLGHEFIKSIKKTYPDLILMADISTLEEALLAEEAGADLVSTTLSGYTPYSPQIDRPDFDLMTQCAKRLSIPVIGEGKIWAPQEAKEALDTGVHAIVVGTAITRPREITRRFVDYINL